MEYIGMGDARQCTKIIVQLCFILCYLSANANALGPAAQIRCVTIVQSNANPYRITDENAVLKGMNQSTTSWYRSIRWNQDVEKDLKLTYRREEYRHNGREEWFDLKNEGSADLCNMRIVTESGSWIHVIREALGIAEGCPVPAGQVNVDGGFFNGVKCRRINLDTTDQWSSNPKQRLSLQVKDSNGNEVLTGALDLFSDSVL
ncbi:uncharacterized protein LOC135160335 [Diachasmimorpha longicaudata]|uniref:uncharacterized protein LOC135160335 n=1 Tax=Diachasmimorpha longicaudata TaxID=58733 RepID=UPI0030B894F2